MLDDFLTGLSGMASLATGGLLPVYGEPENIGVGERGRILVDAYSTTGEQLVSDPALALEAGASQVVGAADELASRTLRGALGGLGLVGWLAVGLVGAHFLGLLKK